MGKYMLKRLVYIVIVFFILSFLLFMIYNMVPGSDKAIEYARNYVVEEEEILIPKTQKVLVPIA